MKPPKRIKIPKRIKKFEISQTELAKPGDIGATSKLPKSQKGPTGSVLHNLVVVGPRGGLLATHKRKEVKGRGKAVPLKNPRYIQMRRFKTVAGPFKVTHIE